MICSVGGCGSDARALGLCTKHYQCLRAHGAPTATRICPPGTPLSDRIAKYTQITSTGCHEWTGSRRGRGYGRIQIEGRSESVHQVAWRLTHGPIPGGLFVCHRCDNPPCCNVAHLFLGTPADNVHDMLAKGRNRNPSGAEHPNTSLTDEDAAAVRGLVAEGHSYSVVASLFGVSRSTIWRSVNHLTRHSTQGETA